MTTSPITARRHDAAGRDNAETVAEIYAAFGRGDVPAVLARLAPDVAWESWTDNFAQRGGVPYLLPRTGREDVAGFFAELATMTVLDFAVLDVIGTGRQVAAEVRASFALPAGGRFADEELHLWTFDDSGLVSRFRHYVDTAKHLAAGAGADTTRGDA
jgi:ketosteroid isomerase-like protein